MQYQGCLLVVKNAQQSKTFYQDLFGCTVNFELEDYVVFEGNLMLQQEDTWLGFIKRPASDLAYKHHTTEIYFGVDDLDGFMKRLIENYRDQIVNPVTEYEWGQRSMRFYDPDGHLIEVGENMDVVVKRYLNSGMTIEEASERSMFPVDFVRKCKDELEKIPG